MSFGDQKTALKMRDLITLIAGQCVDRMRPSPRIGSVLDVDRDGGRARIMFAGEPDPVGVTFSYHCEPSLVGDIVRVAGNMGGYYITDVLTTPEWLTPDYLNGWVTWGAPYGGAEYRKEGGWVNLRGLVKLGTMSTAIFTLPDEYCPEADLVLTGGGSHPATGAVGIRIDVQADGDVVPLNAAYTNNYVSLSGIRFRAK